MGERRGMVQSPWTRRLAWWASGARHRASCSIRRWELEGDGRTGAAGRWIERSGWLVRWWIGKAGEALIGATGKTRWTRGSGRIPMWDLIVAAARRNDGTVPLDFRVGLIHI